MKLTKRMVPEYGIELDGVWIPASLLEELNEQDVYDSQFGDAFTGLNRDQARVLEARKLASRETRGGHHRGPELPAFWDALEYPEKEDPLTNRDLRGLNLTEKQALAKMFAQVTVLLRDRGHQAGGQETALDTLLPPGTPQRERFEALADIIVQYGHPATWSRDPAEWEKTVRGDLVRAFLLGRQTTG